MKKLLFGFIASLFLLAACAPNMSGPEAPVENSATSQPEAPTQTPSPTPEPVSGGGYPPAVFQARDMLAGMLNMASEQVEVVDVQPVDWPDSCLGVETDEICAQVITPGYRVILQVGTARYELHTNADGSVVRQSGEAVPDTSGEEVRFALTWQNENCEIFNAALETAFIGACDSDLSAAEGIDAGYLEVLTEWVQTYAAFNADTPAGKVTLNGFGRLTAAEAEQRMMAEWAGMQYEIARSGRTDLGWRLALAWERQGGIAGFCDDVGVYLDGSVVVSGCRSGEDALPVFYLNASQLEQLYSWQDEYESFEQVYTDPAVADAMTTRLYVLGRGESQPDEQTLQAIHLFASGLAAQAKWMAEAGEEAMASEEALYAFFQALNAQDYAAAAGLYGGDIDHLQGWNPDLGDDVPALLERGCTANGLQCLLPRSITYQGPNESGGHQFIVEFMNPDGTLFRQGPCCGDTTSPSVTSFLVSVIGQQDEWRVMDLPPYVP